MSSVIDPHSSKASYQTFTDRNKFASSRLLSVPLREVSFNQVSATSKLTLNQLDILRVDAQAQEFKETETTRVQSWIALTILLLVQISNQWQRFLISTTYNFVVDVPTSKYYQNPKFEIQYAITGFTPARYGIVAGPLFSLIFGTLVLFSGRFADVFKRNLLLGSAAICWSITSIGMCFTHNFSTVCLCRMLLGVFEAFCAPAAYSLITDLFPPSTRTTANSFFAGCIFVGTALSSVSTVMVSAIGWRQTYFIVGIYGIMAGACVLFLVREPMRGRFDPKKFEENEEEVLAQQHVSPSFGTEQKKQESQFTVLLKGLSSLVANPCTRWLMIAGFLRFWQMSIMSFYIFTYFNYFNRAEAFGVINALVILVGGLSSSIIGGRISDAYEEVNFRTKSYVAATMSILAVPLFCALFLMHSSFYVAIAFLFLENLLCEGWMAPCIAMI